MQIRMHKLYVKSEYATRHTRQDFYCGKCGRVKIPQDLIPANQFTITKNKTATYNLAIVKSKSHSYRIHWAILLVLTESHNLHSSMDSYVSSPHGTPLLHHELSTNAFESTKTTIMNVSNDFFFLL